MFPPPHNNNHNHNNQNNNHPHPNFSALHTGKGPSCLFYFHVSRVRISISCRMNFNDYPLDGHTCQFQVGSCKLKYILKCTVEPFNYVQIMTQRKLSLASLTLFMTWIDKGIFSISYKLINFQQNLKKSLFHQVHF